MTDGQEKRWFILTVLLTCSWQHVTADMPHHNRYRDIYFPRSVYRATMYGDHDVLSPIAQTVAISRGNVTLTYGIRSITCGKNGDEQIVADDSGIFHITPQDGRIYTSVNNLRCGVKGLSNSTWNISISASSDHFYDTALLVVEVKSDQMFPCDPRDICFGQTELSFSVEEESAPAVLFVFPPGYAANSCPHTATYGITQGNEGGDFAVNRRSSALVTTRRLDRETTDRYFVTITCRLHHRAGGRKTVIATVHAEVTDLDDNQPSLQPIFNRQRVVTILDRHKGSNIFSRPVELWDPDLLESNPEVDRYYVAIETELHDFIGTELHVGEQDGPMGVPGTLLDTYLFWKNTVPYMMNGEYSVRLTWKDTSADSLQAENVASLNFTIIVNPIQLQFENRTYKAKVDTRATKFTRVQQLLVDAAPVGGSITYSIASSTERDQGVFRIHPITGNIYLQNETLFSLQAPGVFPYEVRAYDPTTNQTAITRIDIKASIQAPEEDGDYSTICDTSLCASHMNADDCRKGCGPGSANGRCQWRSQLRKRMSRRFATCSPDFRTCPDFVCDRMEQDHPELCPQDCAYEISGLARMNEDHTPARGVGAAAGPCHCGTPRSCICAPGITGEASIPSIKTPEDTQQEPTRPPDNAIYKHATSKNKSPEEKKQSIPTCPFGCQLAIGLGVAVAVSAAVAGVILSRRLSKAPPRDAQEDDDTPNFAVPSMYVNSTYRYRRPSIWDPLFPDTVVASGGYYPLSWVDAKWEIPRENIVLGETIGEGEFGKVVKAQATNVANVKGVSTVAVKMLKDYASASEMRDLISELELLAQVSHPNVIKLIGACTEHGPVYVIVEYAKHGCLRDFLRSKRKDAVLFLDDDFPNINNDEDSLMPKDLLSFAWQITKGMQYLAEMKLVHRDLATRNVLVTDRYVMKISDFGLTRDVYEEDAYMKKSKGRVPVKWLAIESLFDNIYTTKSDVWAFGVLLWEIVTLGATPYPGIPPERVCELLKTGFRMLRPTGCSEELYAIMLKCWQENSEARPTFSELCTELDCMLSKNREYLAIVPDTTKVSDVKNGNVNQWVADSLAHIQREAGLYPPENEETVPYEGLALTSEGNSDICSDPDGLLTPSCGSEDNYELPTCSTDV
ncbi:proto-oncogene tyrosine-protein kinase receptor Ret-like [Branchiostoma lanceolatum]|uniref:proto-oncogene tyrosine-protein kinase receptor Ret-like n=1 Tax=Branchiostoma lanceolatum TaxID=7740 RepID=UPI0034541EAE